MEHFRSSIRLPRFDYRSPGAYFVTICAYQKENIFGEIVNGEMRMNWVGEVIAYEWQKTKDLRSDIALDAFVIMPNHFHGIIWIVERGRGTARRAPTVERSGRPVFGSIPTIVRSFKSAVTGRVHLMNPLFGTVWQRNYYERIIRCDAELNNIRQYIRDNPKNWERDLER